MASSVIGALRVNLGLDSAQFDKGAKRAGASLSSMRKQFVAVAGVAAALGGSLAALAVKVSGTAAEIDRFSKVANAAPSEFQKWAAASASVGVEQEKLADILKDVNDRVGDFVTTGGGPMKDFFEQVAPKVGITAEAFRNLSGPEALQLYVSSLEKAGLSQQEMTFYLEAMASDATTLLPLLRNGGKEMSRLGDNAESLGGIMSDKAVRALAGLKLALMDAGTAMQGVGYRIAGELAPLMTSLAAAFADTMREGGLLRSVVDGLIANLERLAFYIAVAVTAFGVRYVAALAAAKIATMTLTGALTALRGALIRTGIGALIVLAGELVYRFADLVRATGGFGNAMAALGDLAKAVWQGIIDSAAAIPPALDAVWGLMKAGFFDALAGMADGFYRFAGRMAGAASDAGFDALGDRLRGIAVEAGMAAADLGEAGRSASASASAAAANAAGIIEAAFGPARAALQKMKTTAGETAEEIDNTADAATNLGDALDENGGGGSGGAGKGGTSLDKLKEKAEDLKSAVDTLKNGFKSAFDGILNGSKSVREALSDILASFAQMFADQAFNAIWDGAGEKSGGGLGGWFSRILPFANGTNGAPGGMALVGERGPELVNLPRGSQVRTAQDTKRILGGMGGGAVEIILRAPEGFTAEQVQQVRGISVRVAEQRIGASQRARADNEYLRAGR